MKSFLPAVLLSFVFVACASKSKTEAPVVATAPVQTAAPAKPMTKAEAKKAKAQAAKEAKAVKAASKSESSVTTAASATSDSATSVTCKAGSDERVLAIVTKDTGCELHYTKAGKASTIASQVVGNAKCETVMTSVKEKLIASGFSCQ
ncbi:MAG: hypothetical protein H7328_13845 [Bdellovibrio sp.]|nr:hypothetical protein [Bdellovibrio sp.]